MLAERHLHATLAVDLLDAVASLRDFTLTASREHPPVARELRESALEFWRAHGVVGLVVRVYSAASLGSALGEEGSLALRVAAQAYVRHSVLLQQALRNLLLSAQRSGLWIMPIKGIVDARDLYGDASVRFCGDIDVLVKPEQLELARETLRALGYTQSAMFGALGPKAQGWWLATDHATEWKNATTGVFVDLHWRLNDRRMVSFDDTGWYDSAQRASCWGAPCERLPVFERYVALLTHAARSNWFYLRWWTDLVRARAEAAQSASAESLVARLQACGALELDRRWLAAFAELSSACVGVPRRDSAVGWLLSKQRPTSIHNLRSALRHGYGWKFFALWIRKDMAFIELPETQLPLYFIKRPALSGWRVLRNYLGKSKAK